MSEITPKSAAQTIVRYFDRHWLNWTTESKIAEAERVIKLLADAYDERLSETAEAYRASTEVIRKFDEELATLREDREKLRAELAEAKKEHDKLRDHVADLITRRECIRNFVPQTYGDAILAGWLQHGDVENHEWDNRTSEENAVWVVQWLFSQIEKVKEERDASKRLWIQAEEGRKFATSIMAEELLSAQAALREIQQAWTAFHRRFGAVVKAEIRYGEDRIPYKQMLDAIAKEPPTELLDKVVEALGKAEHYLRNGGDWAECLLVVSTALKLLGRAG